MTRQEAQKDMMDGYLDGLNFFNPAPSLNRTKSYIHGFLNGRDDLSKTPRATAAALAIAKGETT